MKDSLLVDPTYEQFDEMSRLVKGDKGLYVPFDNDMPIEKDESKWTNDYMDKEMVRVVRNFSHERLNHLKKVVRKLHPANK